MDVQFDLAAIKHVAEGKTAILSGPSSAFTYGVLSSRNATYATARSGSNLTRAVSSLMGIGQSYLSSQYYIYYTHLSFDLTSISVEAVESAKLRIWNIADWSVQDFIIEVREFDFGTLETTDWVAGASLSTKPLVGYFSTEDIVAERNWIEIDIDVDAITPGSVVYFILNSNRTANGDAPSTTVDERIYIYRYTGTSEAYPYIIRDPRLDPQLIINGGGTLPTPYGTKAFNILAIKSVDEMADGPWPWPPPKIFRSTLGGYLNSNTNDGSTIAESHDIALAGTDVLSLTSIVDYSTAYFRIGQTTNPVEYWYFVSTEMSFLTFDLTDLPVDAVIKSAYLTALTSYQLQGGTTAVLFDMEVRKHDFGETFEVGDWVVNTDIENLTLLGSITTTNAQTWNSISIDLDETEIVLGEKLQLIINSDHQRSAVRPAHNYDEEIVMYRVELHLVWDTPDINFDVIAIGGGPIE